MPSPASNSPNDVLPAAASRRRRWPWMALAVLLAAPLLLTLVGVVTAPPRAAFVPAGRIVFLEADQPSEHTSLLRGLRVTLAGSSASREVLHETEPQDVDAGSRDWIAQPTVSPDGRWLAYEKQLITLQEEKTGIVYQLWTVPLNGSAPPHLLADLTARRIAPPIGLTWTPDSRQVAFLSDTLQYSVNAEGGPPHLAARPLPLTLPPLANSPGLSATRNLTLLGPQSYALAAQTTLGTEIVAVFGSSVTRLSYPHPPVPLWAAAPDGRLATLVPKANAVIDIRSAGGTAQAPALRQIRPRWGWSVFGGRRVTSLKWSPDGRFLGYTVSKPPFEDELFYADVRTGRCYQLPIRTGRAAWDWTR